MADQLTAVSLFTGAGGLDLGVEQAGFRTVFAVENDPIAVRTLNANRRASFPGLPEVEPLDITALDPRQVMKGLGVKRGDVDFLVGGPPVWHSRSPASTWSTSGKVEIPRRNCWRTTSSSWTPSARPLS